MPGSLPCEVMKRLLFVGAGVAHLQALRALAGEALPDTEISLIVPAPRWIDPVMLPGFVAGRHAIEHCGVPLASLAERGSMNVLQGTPAEMDIGARCLTLTDGRVLPYDAVSLAPENTIDRDAIRGAREHALFLQPVEVFVQLWDRMCALAQDRPLCVVVVGSDTPAVELALALQHRLGDRSRVGLVTGGECVLPGRAPGLRQRVQRLLRRRRVTLLEERCDEITATHLLLSSGTRVACDAAVIALRPGLPSWLRGAGLPLDERGALAVGDSLQSLARAEVFAPGEGRAAGAVLATNLRRFIAGSAPEARAPRASALEWLGCGDGRAIASWRGVSVEGRWLGRWKERDDRALVQSLGGGV